MKATTRPAPIAACAAVKAGFDMEAGVARAARDPDKAHRIQEEGETAFVKCWTERVKDQPSFAALVRQTQEIADALAVP